MVVPIYDDNPFAQAVKPVVTWCLIVGQSRDFRSMRSRATPLALERLIETFSLIPAALFGYMPSPGTTARDPDAGHLPVLPCRCRCTCSAT